MKKNKRREKVEQILDAVHDRRDVPEALTNRLDRLFVSNEHDADYDAVLTGLLEAEMSMSGRHSAKARESLVRAQRKLGMPESVFPSSIPLRRRLYFKVAAAAAVALLVVGGYLAFFMQSEQARVADFQIETIDGVQKHIQLPDNTRIWINSDSRLTAYVSGNKRKVNLDGEAYFDVKHDRKRPFIVYANGLEVKVLGTEFDVKAYPGDGQAEVFLDKGRVKVKDGWKRETLEPGMKLTRYNATGGMWVGPIGAREDWRSDVISADARTLPQLLRMIGNYYDMKISIEEDRLNDTQIFSTKFGREQSAEMVLSSLAKLSGEFEYSINEDTIIITTKNRE